MKARAVRLENLSSVGVYWRLVEHVLGFRSIDVVLGHDDEAGVHLGGNRLLRDSSIIGSLDSQVAHVVGALNSNGLEGTVLDEALQDAIAVETNRHDLACESRLLDRAAHADGGRLVGAENAYQVRVGSEHVRGLVERGGHVGVGVLRRNDLRASSSPRCSP